MSETVKILNIISKYRSVPNTIICLKKKKKGDFYFIHTTLTELYVLLSLQRIGESKPN